MATRNATFSLAAAADGGVTSSMQLQVHDSAGTLVAAASLPATATTFTATLPLGTHYSATLKAFSAGGVIDPSPPTVTFDVTAPPPPPTPGDPTLNPPVLS